MNLNNLTPSSNQDSQDYIKITESGLSIRKILTGAVAGSLKLFVRIEKEESLSYNCFNEYDGMILTVSELEHEISNGAKISCYTYAERGRVFFIIPDDGNIFEMNNQYCSEIDSESFKACCYPDSIVVHKEISSHIEITNSENFDFEDLLREFSFKNKFNLDEIKFPINTFFDNKLIYRIIHPVDLRDCPYHEVKKDLYFSFSDLFIKTEQAVKRRAKQVDSKDMFNEVHDKYKLQHGKNASTLGQLLIFAESNGLIEIKNKKQAKEFRKIGRDEVFQFYRTWERRFKELTKS